jgi:DNA repair photolyase
MLTNTKQWARYTINLFTGKCKNGCIYCYRNADIARFKQSPEMVIKTEFLTKDFRKRNDLTMYPSSHDIRFDMIEHHLAFLKNFLRSGSNILVVSKADMVCFRMLCNELKPFKEQIEFRITIGSFSNDVIRFYEPNAPSLFSRLHSLIHAHRVGYKTSLSIEPMLDKNPEQIVEKVSPFISENIWIGKMNLAKVRLTLNGHADKWPQVQELVNWQANDQNILELVQRLSKYHKIKWKDSIQKVIDEDSKMKRICNA